MIRFSRLLAACLPAILLAALLGGAPARAADEASENAVRAALLFNFLKFTEWPAGALGSTHLQLCIASGNAELLAAMEKLNARKLHGRAVLVTRYRSQAGCDALYVDGGQHWMDFTEGSAATLTVGDYRGFAAAGGMIEISLHEGASRFDINLAKARRAGLRLSPQMLKLARRVIE
jgi:hypothetical protein